VVTGVGVICYGLAHLEPASPPAYVVPQMLAMASGALLLVGLWTPITGVIVAVVELWMIVLIGGPVWTLILLATLGATLAMIGPGAWSIDARLFGRKHIRIT
jgi:putative oxidoreductase